MKTTIQKGLDEIVERALGLRSGAQQAAQSQAIYAKHQVVPDLYDRSRKVHYGLKLFPDKDVTEGTMFNVDIDHNCKAKRHLMRPWRRDYFRDDKRQIWTIDEFHSGSYLDIRQMQPDFATVRTGVYVQNVDQPLRFKNGLLLAVRNGRWEKVSVETYDQGQIKQNAEVEQSIIDQQIDRLGEMEEWTRRAYGFPEERIAPVIELDSRRPKR